MAQHLAVERMLAGMQHVPPMQQVQLCRGEARVELAALRQRRAVALYDAAADIECCGNGADGQEPLAAADAAALGCCYRRRGEIELAIEILYQGVSNPRADVLSAASNHLNLGAALALIGRHKDALDQANAALIVLQEELFNTVNMPMEAQLAEGAQRLADGLQIEGDLAPAQVAAEAARRLMEAEHEHFERRALHLLQLHKHEEAREVRREQKRARDRQRAAVASSPTLLVEIQRLCKVFGLQLTDTEEATAEMAELEESWLTAKVTLLAAAYHNAGVEQEALRNYDLAVQSYADATNLARTHLGRDSNVTLTLAASRDAAARENPKTQSSERLVGEVTRELRGIFKSHRMQLRDAFQKFDTNNDGAIDEREMRKGLARLNLGLSAQQVEDLLAVLDRNGDGRIDYSEFEQQFGDGPRPGQKDLAAEITGRRWGKCSAEVHTGDRIEAGQTFATEAALIAGRWAAPSIAPESVGSWPLDMVTVVQSPPPILVAAHAELPEPEKLADIGKLPKTAKPKVDWSEAALRNILNFDASLALSHTHAQERARQKSALLAAEQTLAEDIGSHQFHTNQIVTQGSGASSPGSPLDAALSKSQQENDEKRRLARQHTVVCAPWRDREAWQGAAKEEMQERKKRLERQATTDRHCFNTMGVRNTAKASPYIQKIEEMSKAGNDERNSEPENQPEQVQEHHISEAFALINLVRGAFDRARSSGGAMAEDAVLGPGLAGAVSPAVLFRAIDEVCAKISSIRPPVALRVCVCVCERARACVRPEWCVLL